MSTHHETSFEEHGPVAIVRRSPDGVQGYRDGYIAALDYAVKVLDGGITIDALATIRLHRQAMEACYGN